MGAPLLCSPNTPCLMKPSQNFSFAALSIFPRRRITTRITCQDRHEGSVDRRKVLIGLGGLYGGSAGSAHDRKALALPIETPKIETCGPADLPNDPAFTDCCPPNKGLQIEDFKPPQITSVRVRPPAHAMSTDQLEKYEMALKLMRELPEDDPRNFFQQAKIHCAYCDGGYYQVGFPDLELQVHSSWLFYPWHRFYLYFFERILSDLISDDTFVLPFWSWDSPPGMTMPVPFTNPNSSLFDALRDQSHLPPTLVDLDFGDEDFTDPERIQDNLAIMYRQMISNAKTKELFFGGNYVAGDQPSPEGGSIENVPHNTVHVWVGDPRQPNGEDMGTFYSAARDPIFFAHHANVDRMWNVWKGLNARNKDPKSSDWLDASFVFYDEKAKPVRVRVRNCLDSEKQLGYVYEDVELSWLESKPKPTPKPEVPKTPERIKKEPTFPVTLDSPIRITVKRPKTSRTPEQKEKEEEVLVVSDIQVGQTTFAKFNVYINCPADQTLRPDAAGFAGSFCNLPHMHKNNKKNAVNSTTQKFGLNDLLEEINADGDKEIVVTLFPCKGTITVGGVKIEYSNNDL